MELFPTENAWPEGFTYHPDFLTKREELDYIALLQSYPLHTFIFQGYEAKRKVRSFGYDYNFDQRLLKKGEPIPDVFQPLLQAVSEITSIASEAFTEMLLTEYSPGSVINWHRDAPPFEVVIGLSLGADCIFKLRPHDKEKQSRKALISFPVRRRSLYVMRDVARTEWQHSTAPVTATRYSITLRTLYPGNLAN